MLIVFPITFFMAAPALDVIHVATGDALWARIAFWDIVLGVITALAAAVPGFVDYLSLHGRAGLLATYHLVLNLTVVVLFGANLFLRGEAAQAWLGNAIWIPLALSIVGAVILGVSGWIGGHLVYVHRVGVSDDARDEVAQRRRAA
jgi:uncharacterized membrane protein